MNSEQHIWVGTTIMFGEGAENLPIKFETLTFTGLFSGGYSGGAHSVKNGIKPLFF